ncbi:unnamed protein product [Owenia fusiformis]|uniref:Uncharacterized protein n=2 Tax=Owenia fusiformis TaxID=6347 RepID=A0A8S4N0N0_OWEFU|nr:unnamed protein product [Owenia fusiformis]
MEIGWRYWLVAMVTVYGIPTSVETRSQDNTVGGNLNETRQHDDDGKDNELRTGKAERSVDLLDYTLDQETHLVAIIEALEKLEIIATQHQLCYTLQKVVRSIRSVQNGSEIELKMTIKSSREINGKLTADKVNTLKNNSVVLYDVDNTTKSNCLPVTSGSAMETTTNSSIVATGDKQLGRTQVMVIVTCSVVIGVFFILAGLLRIKSYIKRRREAEAAARALRSTNNVCLKNKDQDKASFKQSRQAKTNGSVEIAETNPLLIITSASAPTSPLLDSNTCQMSSERTSQQDEASQGSWELAEELANQSDDSKKQDVARRANDDATPDCTNNGTDEIQKDETVHIENTPQQSSPKDQCISADGGHEPPHENIYQTNIGINQSNSSLSSYQCNPSYSYGNQTEYGCTQYGNYAYTPLEPTEEAYTSQADQVTEAENEENNENQETEEFV